MPNRSCSTVQQVSKAKSQVLRCAYNCQMSIVPQTTELDGLHERHSLQFINKHTIKRLQLPDVYCPTNHWTRRFSWKTFPPIYK